MPIGNGGIIGPANVPTITTASGVWSLREQQQAQGRGAWPLALTPDPYFEYTTLLLPGNGTDGANNNAFLDSSTNNFTITRNGNTTQGTFSPFSQTGWGNYFNGSGRLALGVNSAFDITQGNFTVEAWVNISAYTSQHIAHYRWDTPSSGWILRINATTGYLQFSYIGGSGVISTSAVPLNSWVHVAACRSGGTCYLFINGTQVGSASFSNGTTNTTLGLRIGADSSGTENLIGYISNFRLVKNGALYTSSFTPSTTPLTTSVSSGTVSVLTCQSNRFIDNSSNTFNITQEGATTSVVAFSPFNPTLPWIASINGGSGYFDGNTDYLTAADSASFDLGANNWTMELWAYFNSVSGEKGLISHFAAGTPNAGYTLRLSTSNSPSGLRLVCSGSSDVVLQAAFTPVVGSWYHIAAVRSSGTLYIYVNGKQIGSTSIAITIGNPSALFAVGTAQTVASSDFNGYISNVRLVNGAAVYTGEFTPPTAPITDAGSTSAASYPSTTNVNTSFASSATRILLNFTNAGIYDATSKNDLETLDNTVNGVRISTAQSQFGGSSIYFDGTGTDYLWIQADQPIQRFGTAPFTIELWIRLAATGSARGLVAKGTSTTGWLVSLNSSNQVVFTYGTSTITSTGTISANDWTYIAVVREGTGANQTKIYIGGVNDGTGTVSTDFTQTSSMYIGADRTGGSLFSGYMQDVRITNGSARTVTTIPTTAFPLV